MTKIVIPKPPPYVKIKDESEMTPRERWQKRWDKSHTELQLMYKLIHTFFETYEAKLINGDKNTPPRADLKKQHRLYQLECHRLHNERIQLCLEMYKLKD